MHYFTFNSVKKTVHDTVAHSFALNFHHNISSIYSQHIPGEENIIADSLSRDFHLSDEDLTNVLLTTSQTDGSAGE